MLICKLRRESPAQKEECCGIIERCSRQSVRSAGAAQGPSTPPPLRAGVPRENLGWRPTPARKDGTGTGSRLMPAGPASGSGTARSLDLHVLRYALVHEGRAEAGLVVLLGPALLRRQDLHEHGACGTALAALLVVLSPRLLKLLPVHRRYLVELWPMAHSDLNQRPEVQAALHPVDVQDRLADAPGHKGAPVWPQGLLLVAALLEESLVLPEPPLDVGILHQQAAVKGPVDVERAPHEVAPPYDRRVGQARVEHGVDLRAVALRGDVPVGDDPQQLQLHPHAALPLVLEVEVGLRHLVLEDRQPLLLYGVDQLGQAGHARVEAHLLVELLHRGRQHRLVDLEQSLLSGLHGPHRKVEALVHARVTEIPPHRSLLHLAVEVSHETGSLLRLLVEEVDHVHVLLELVPRLLRVGEGPVLPAVVELLAPDGPDDHLAGDHGLLRSGFQPPLLDPVGRLIRVAFAVFLYAELPDGTVRGDLLDPCGNVIACLASKGRLVLAQLPPHLSEQEGRVFVARVNLHAELQVLLGLVPNGVRPVGVSAPVQGLVVRGLLVEDLVGELLDLVPLAAVQMELSEVVPQHADQRDRLRRRLSEGQQHLDAPLPVHARLVVVALLEGLIPRLFQGGLDTSHAEGLVAGKMLALDPAEVSWFVPQLAPPLILLLTLLINECLHLLLGLPDLLLLVLAELIPDDIPSLHAFLLVVLPNSLEPAVVEPIALDFLARFEGLARRGGGPGGDRGRGRLSLLLPSLQRVVLLLLLLLL
mmetsp:Transcript_67740/g.209470  ORF Transcript_67740/g.209470 Transcript_67740/m.209470 type:complete len:760 (-) Transcript_67740:131-2410(-)